jgi:uncharacterized protein YybS (DUF2232 family)
LSKKKGSRRRQRTPAAPVEVRPAPSSQGAPAFLTPIVRPGGLQGLTEGAILAALVAALALATRYVPVLGAFTALLCPLPLAVLVVRHGFKSAAVAGVVATLVATTLAGPVVGMAILVSFAPMGLVLGLGTRRGWPASRTIMVGGVVAFVAIMLNYYGFLGGERVSMDEMSETMERSVEMAAGFYARMGMPQAQIDSTVGQVKQMARLFPYIFPGGLVLSGIVAAWLNYEVGRRVLRRFGFEWPALQPIRTWRIPAVVILAVPLGYALLVAGARLAPEVPIAEVLRARLDPGPPLLERVGIGLILTSQSLFTMQGLLVGWVVLGNYGFGRFAQIAAIAMTFVIPFLALVMYSLGLLDSIMKIRDRWGVQRAPAPEGTS